MSTTSYPDKVVHFETLTPLQTASCLLTDVVTYMSVIGRRPEATVDVSMVQNWLRNLKDVQDLLDTVPEVKAIEAMDIANCLYCGKPFYVGPHNPFCSERCAYDEHYVMTGVDYG